METVLDYLYMEAFCHGLAVICTDDEQKGMMDKSGKVILPPIYDWICCSEKYEYVIAEKGGFYQFYDNDKRMTWIRGRYGVLDLDGRVLIPFEYSEIMWCSEDCLRVESDEKFGVINLQNEIVLPLEYDWLGYPYENGWMVAEREGKWGIITLKGEIIIPFVYDSIQTEGLKESGLILAKYKGVYFLMNPEGERILTLNEGEGKKVVGCGDFYAGRLVVAVEDTDGTASGQKKKGMIDTAGRWMIPPVYDDVRHTGGEYVLVKQGATGDDSFISISGKCGVVDLNNNIVLPIEYEGADWLMSENGDCWNIKNAAGLWGVVN
ncbi:MAG: WG repeat-containing protein, partial [Odoribacter sp.]|nr:WG repeat-containing protein [Odoribacter sp.]